MKEIEITVKNMDKDDFEIYIGSKKFTKRSTWNWNDYLVAISAEILKQKFDAELIVGGGSLFTKSITFYIGTKMHTVVLSDEYHYTKFKDNPNYPYLRNVISKHVKIIEDELNKPRSFRV